MRYFFLFLFFFFALGSGTELYRYLSGSFILDPDDYDWIEGRFEKVEQLRGDFHDYYEQREFGIRIKLAEYQSMCWVDGRNTTSGAFELALQHPDIFNDNEENLVGKQAFLQIRKDKKYQLEQGKVPFIWPRVVGLKIEGETVYTLEDINQNTDSSFWLTVSLLSVFTIGGFMGTLFQITALRKAKMKVSE